ncbi:MAG: ABC transporter ATP-binding protein [candidate division NC10 bacterium]|nr:ABC transporter ATP-binding protein [candidate division NC10 bacterium]
MESAARGIRLEGLSKVFWHQTKGEVWAVREVSLAVAPGEFVTLLGPSGCGKTTALRMIAGFEQPSAGRVFIGEQDVTALMANQRNIGFVFQNYALFPHLPIFENVAYGLRVRKEPQAEIARAVREVMALVGLAGYERQFPNQLSGGEQQRVALARAIVVRPQVLLLDEPLSNLDAKLRVHMRAEIRRLQETLHITTVYVTHDQEEAMALADRIAVMEGGRIVQVGTAEDLYARPANAFVAQFIGRTNLLPARVRGTDAAGVEVECNGRILRLPRDSGPGSAGQAVRLAVRPETIELTRVDGGGGDGEVVSRVFLGEKVEYLVRWGALTLHVIAYNPIQQGVLAPGERVGIRLALEGTRILPGEAS